MQEIQIQILERMVDFDFLIFYKSHDLNQEIHVSQQLPLF